MQSIHAVQMLRGESIRYQGNSAVLLFYAMSFNLDAYKQRLNLSGALAPSEQSLREIHLAHIFTLTYENIDVYIGKPILLDAESLTQKMVLGGRGGYCFELNLLLMHALQAFGFEVTPMLARRMYQRPNSGPRSHILLRVKVGEREWLADAGFGGLAFRSPLPFEVGKVDEQFGESFRLQRDPEIGFTLQRKLNGEWTSIYGFAADKTFPGDIEMSNWFTSTWPESNFLKKVICVQVTPHGQLSLTGKELREIEGDSQNIKILSNSDEIIATLTGRFGLQLSNVVIDALRIRLGRAESTT
jgi:N-hydroxyarylamine O-acetyltransferase